MTRHGELRLPIRLVHPGTLRDDEIQERDDGRQLASGDDGVAAFEAAPERLGAALTFSRERALVESAAPGEPDILLPAEQAAHLSHGNGQLQGSRRLAGGHLVLKRQDAWLER